MKGKVAMLLLEGLKKASGDGEKPKAKAAAGKLSAMEAFISAVKRENAEAACEALDYYQGAPESEPDEDDEEEE